MIPAHTHGCRVADDCHSKRPACVFLSCGGLDVCVSPFVLQWVLKRHDGRRLFRRGRFIHYSSQDQEETFENREETTNENRDLFLLQEKKLLLWTAFMRTLAGGWITILYADKPDTSRPADTGIHSVNIEQPGRPLGRRGGVTSLTPSL